jgi:uncharacterized protein (TIGR03083 family)
MTEIDNPDTGTLLAALHRSHGRLADTLAGLPDERASGPSYDNEGTIAQVASHLGSTAQIFGQFLTAGLTGTPAPGVEQFRPVWDEWNAKSATEQVRDAIDADARFLEILDALPAHDRERWQLAMFGSHQTLAGLLRMRLAEHALHTWDIAVALDPAATVPADAAELVIDNLAAIADRVGKPTGDTLAVDVHTETPPRHLRLELDAERVRLRPGDPTVPAATLRLPGEALIRLVYGRLDPAHTPAAVRAENLDLDALRRAFPGV